MVKGWLVCVAGLLAASGVGRAEPFVKDEHTLLLAHYDDGIDADFASDSPRARGRASLVAGRWGKAARAVKGWLTPDMSLLDIDGFPLFETVTYHQRNVDPRHGCLEMWVRFDPVAEPEYFRRVMTWEAGSSYVILALRPEPKERSLRLLVSAPEGAASLITPFPYEWNDQWHHLGIQWTETTYGLILDGKVVVERPAPLQGLPPPKTRIAIGGHHRGLNLAEALIDELRISDAPRYGK